MGVEGRDGRRGGKGVTGVDDKKQRGGKRIEADEMEECLRRGDIYVVARGLDNV